LIHVLQSLCFISLGFGQFPQQLKSIHLSLKILNIDSQFQ